MHGPGGFGGPGFGGPGFGGPHGPMGPRPLFGFHHHHCLGGSLFGIGLTAMLGSMLGNSISNRNNSYVSSNNQNGTTVYELYNYCPNCGAKRTNGNTKCSYCNSSLIK